MLTVPVTVFADVDRVNHFSSGEHQNYLIELYTSEGCSSCPPADRWLSKIKESDKLWNDVIPIAFHVDYWDYIGWKDKFADKRYSNRQRNYARQYRETTVYTPGIRVNGFPWGSWRDSKLDEFNDLDDAALAGNLSLSTNKENEFNALFLSKQPIKDNGLVLNVAILGMEIKTKVQRGENSGRMLNQDFVVLAYEQYKQQVNAAWNATLPTISDSLKGETQHLALVAWVNSVGNLNPIQAVGGFLK
jgi:hypothetical protein